MRTSTVSPARLAARQFFTALVGVILAYAVMYGFVAFVWAVWG